MLPHRRARPFALVALLACVLAACQGQARHPAAAGMHPQRLAARTTDTPPPAEVVKISKPTPIPPLGSDGRYLRQQPPGDTRPTVSAGDAVGVALRHQEASNPG